MGKFYNLGLYEKAMPNHLSLREKLECAKELGFDFVQFSVDETEEKMSRIDMSKEERLDIIKTCFEVGLHFKSMALSGLRKYPLGSRNPEIREKSIEIVKKAVLLSSDLSIPIIQMAGYDEYYEPSDDESAQNFVESLHEIVPFAAKEGVILTFESMETPFMDTVEKMMKYVKMMNSPYFGAYPDSGNITNSNLKYNTDVLEDLRKGKGHLNALHLKESLPGKYRDLQFGTGHVDFEAMIKVAHELEIKRFVIEMWYLGQDNWKEDIAFARNYLTKYLDASYGS